MTHPKLAALSGRYETLIQKYLIQAAEISLEEAYEIGKIAISAGVGPLEISQLHFEVIERVMKDLSLMSTNRDEVYIRAQAVLNECLAPYEAAYRGFREANDSLRHLNRSLVETNKTIADAHQRQEFLARATLQLSTSLDQEEVIQRVLGLATEQIAVGALLEITSRDSVLEHRVFGSAHESGFTHESESELCILKFRSVELEARVQEGLWDQHFKTPLPKNIFWNMVPLRSHREFLGTLIIIQPSKKNQDPELLKEFTLRVCTALENARLYRESQMAVRARENILSIVSHDLRNPLNSVSLNAEMVLRQFSDKTQDSALRLSAERIKKSVKTMSLLIEDILDLARIDAGKLAITPTICKVGMIVEDAAAMMRPIAEDRTIELKTEILCEAEDVYCDAARILQVFSNLIANAIKFTPKGGTITIRGKLLDDTVLFSVWDTGQGIPREKLPYIFDRLWQAEPSNRAGIGFGLYISRMIVEAHGGVICPDSTPSQGSTFFFTLPRRAPKALAEPLEQAG